MPLSPDYHAYTDKCTRAYSSQGESTGTGSGSVKEMSRSLCAEAVIFLRIVKGDLAACQVDNTRSVSSVGSSRRDLQLTGLRSKNRGLGWGGGGGWGGLGRGSGTVWEGWCIALHPCVHPLESW
jgi:hypothetical protein